MDSMTNEEMRRNFPPTIKDALTRGRLAYTSLTNGLVEGQSRGAALLQPSLLSSSGGCLSL